MDTNNTNKRILFFDDELYLSEFLIINLRDNFKWKNIKCVSSVGDFFDVITNKNNHYDLFIMDVMSPVSQTERNNLSNDEIRKIENGMSTGLVLADKIWEINQYKDAPILFLSAKKITLPEGKKCAYFRKLESAQNVSDKMKELLNL